VYRNGTQITGDPAAVKFTTHDEIVVWLGLTTTAADPRQLHLPQRRIDTHSPPHRRSAREPQPANNHGVTATGGP
jgi:hypothetical protein